MSTALTEYSTPSVQELLAGGVAAFAGGAVGYELIGPLGIAVGMAAGFSAARAVDRLR